MKTILAIFGLSAILLGTHAATTFIRSPQYDSAVIQSDRLGGNFAYSTVEGQAYTAYSPIVKSTYRPVAYEYSSYPHYQQYTTYPTQSFILQQPFISTFPTYQFGAESNQQHHQQTPQGSPHEQDKHNYGGQNQDGVNRGDNKHNIHNIDDSVTVEAA